MRRIEIQCENGIKLIAEPNPDPTYPRELFIFLEDQKGCVIQDLAVIRQSYSYENEQKVKWHENFQVLLYGDAENEDITDEFVINVRNDLDAYH